MRWFKHLVRSRDEAALIQIKEKYGLAGYGAYWIIMELVAEQYGGVGVPSLECSVRTWSKTVGLSVPKFRRFVELCADLDQILLKVSGQNLKIECHKLLQLKDDYSKKSGHKRNVCPDIVRTQAPSPPPVPPLYPKRDQGTPPISPPEGDLFGCPLVEPHPKAAPKRKSTAKTNEPPPYSDLFSAFWTAYPRKEAKAKAWEAWQKIRPVPDEELLAEMIQTINRYKATVQWQLGVDHIPHPTTWLNGRRWEDSPAGTTNQEHVYVPAHHHDLNF